MTEHLDYLWTYLWYIVRHVMFVIYMWCWWYICAVDDIYVMLVMFVIYILFVWMGCKKQIKRLFSVTLPSAMTMTLGKVTTWEHALPSAKAIALGKHHRFAECHGPGTRQRSPVCRVSCRWHSALWPPLPSVRVNGARQRGDLCRVFDLNTRQSCLHGGAHHHSDFSLPSVWLALGKGFIECPIKYTR